MELNYIAGLNIEKCFIIIIIIICIKVRSPLTLPTPQPYELEDDDRAVFYRVKNVDFNKILEIYDGAFTAGYHPIELKHF